MSESSDVGVLDMDVMDAEYKAARRKMLVELFQLFGTHSSSVEIRKRKIRIVIEIPFEPTDIELRALETALERQNYDPWTDPHHAKDPQ